MDKDFIYRACELARGGLGNVSPNPLVGALVVKGHKIIGEGFHKSCGNLHAEVEAMRVCKESVVGSTLYCNLEPCSTVYPGKQQPPCCDVIISSGIKKVVIGQLDPNPHVAGNGVQRLREAGIEVEIIQDIDDIYYLNRVFNRSFDSKKPWVHLKWAQSLDGSIALSNGVSKWITDEECRTHAHSLRHEYDAIIVGKNTLLEDNPELSVRYGYDSDIKPVIFDRKLELDRGLNVFKNNPLVICSDKIPSHTVERYPFDMISLPEYPYNLDLLLERLKEYGINSLMVEGGANLLTAFYKSGLWDELSVYIAPKLLGSGVNPLGRLDLFHPSECNEFYHNKFTPLGDHMLFSALKERLCSPV